MEDKETIELPELKTQLTGLKDKNGVHVCNGDSIEVEGYFDGYYFVKKHNSKVHFLDGDFYSIPENPEQLGIKCGNLTKLSKNKVIKVK